MIYAVALFFALAALMQYRKILKLKRFKKNSHQAIAKITEKSLKEEKWGIEKCWLHYTFEDAQNIVRQGKASVGVNMFKNKAIGDSIDILFLTEAPESSCVKDVYLEKLSSHMTWVMINTVSAVLIPLFF